MPYSDYPHGTIATRGEEIYHHQLREKIEPKHKGKFLTIDIETGDYEIDAERWHPQCASLKSTPRLSSTVYELDFRQLIESALKFRGQPNDHRKNHGTPRSCY